MNVETFNMLLRKMRDGDTCAFEKLYRYLSPKIIKAFRAYTGNEDFGYDVAHNFFIKIRTMNEIGYIKYPISWSIRVCKNDVINEMRRAARVENVDENYLANLEAATSCDTYDLGGMFGELTDAVDRLAPRERTVIAMREALGYGYEEIAEELGVTYGNARQIHSRACKNLKNFLK